jgi:hypothetical protein
VPACDAPTPQRFHGGARPERAGYHAVGATLDLNQGVGCDSPSGDYVSVGSAASRMDRRPPLSKPSSPVPVQRSRSPSRAASAVATGCQLPTGRRRAVFGRLGHSTRLQCPAVTLRRPPVSLGPARVAARTDPPARMYRPSPTSREQSRAGSAHRKPSRPACVGQGNQEPTQGTAVRQ